MDKKKIIIRGGKVHDVGYRLHLLQKAEELLIPNIGAWNLHDNGKEIVRVLVGGDEGKVKEFLHFVRESFPEEATVEGTPTVEDYEGGIPGIEAFSRSFSTAQLTKIAKVGVGMLKMQKQTVETLNTFREESGKKQDKMLEKQDQTIEILGGKIDNGFEKIDNDFTVLRSDYGKISQTMEKILDCLVQQQKDSTEATNRLTAAILKLAEKK